MDVTALQFRPMTESEADLLLFQRCFAANGVSRPLGKLRWQFRQPPAGALYIDFAVEPTEPPVLAAVYAVFPVWMRVAGQRVLGVQSLDTMTDARFRGKGLFVKMAKALFERCATGDVALVYGFPNGNSAHGFFTKLGWATLDPVPHLLKPLRLGYVTRKLKLPARLVGLFDIPLTRAAAPRLRRDEQLRTVTQFDEAFTALWQVFARDIAVAVEREADYLSWRMQRPEERYEAIALYAGPVLRGYVIIGSNQISGTEIGKVMELVFVPGDSRAGALLLAEAVSRLYARGCEVAWSASFPHSPNRRALLRAGFLPPPARLMPSEMHLGARALSGVPQELVARRASWYISLLDSDTH